jgi:hypothetical protein
MEPGLQAVEFRMGSKIFDMPRHKRPLWEVIAFAAALAGLVGLAISRVTVNKTLSASPDQALKKVF